MSIDENELRGILADTVSGNRVILEMLNSFAEIAADVEVTSGMCK